ncbi:hypothetical protein [Plantibacter sp. CFBP 8775]|uniref:hypothetical protein n=1 Tax=Plantibacter sp. CFBP 8775 TaxID=2774038 RepID=UPI001783FD8D|nr:hypothetical protein [Plantibacter sp. CFBP 8775]MBD8103987.1 hypothetical protein [Plantibacter sp. CFBP 8775]
MRSANARFKYVEWNKLQGAFVEVPSSNLSAPPDPDLTTWWHAAADLAEDDAPQSLPGVTHLGDLEAARSRANAHSAFGKGMSGIYEVGLRRGLAVMPKVYVENSGQKEMRYFEQKLLDSEFDLAFTWNVKESRFGTWTIIVRRSVLGELPNNLGQGFTLLPTRPLPHP